MVQRYDAGCLYAGEDEMQEEIDGEYIKYEDYAALLLKLEATRSHLERAEEAPRHMLVGYVKKALRILG